MKNRDVNIQYAQHPAYAEAPGAYPIPLHQEEPPSLNFVFILPCFSLLSYVCFPNTVLFNFTLF